LLTAVQEIKNGRLAMLAFLGMMIQAQTTHSGPVQNLVVSSARACARSQPGRRMQLRSCTCAKGVCVCLSTLACAQR